MSGVFGGNKSAQSTTPTRLNAIQIMQSSYGNCIPLQYGTDRLPLTLIDYVDFTSTPVSQSQGGKGGGGKTVSSYTYAASWIGAVCEGPILQIHNVFQNQSVTTTDGVGVVVFPGSSTQAPWSYMQQHHPDHALPYNRTAYVAATNYQLGSNAGLPNLTFEVIATLPTAPNGFDSHPRDFIPDYCNDANHGAGFPYLADISDFGNYCTAMGFFFSPSEATQRGAVDFINEVLQMTNSNAVWSPGVGLRFVPYCDAPVTGNGVTYTPNLTPIYELFDDDYAIIDEQGNTAPVVVDITPANETFNCWNVEFLDRSNQYNTNVVQYQDELDVSVNGLRSNNTISLHAIKDAGVAKLVATLLCNRNLYIRTQFTLKARADFCLLEPMDLISINDSRVGIVDQLVRIISVTDEADDSLTIVAEEMVVGPASAPLYNTQLAQAFAQNFLSDPGPVSVPYMFTFPPKLADPAASGYELGIAVGGTGGEWGGAEVWMSLDNLTYWRVGLVDAPSRYGVTTQTLPVGNDPDTSNVLPVQLNTPTPLTMVSGTRTDADRLLTPCIVDGEIISYQTVAAQGNNAFSLSYLRRGKYGSTIAQHAAGSKFAVIDQDIFRMKFDPGYAGLPFWVKFRSFNLFGGGTESLASVAAYQGFFQGQNGGVLESPGAVELVARGQCVVSGVQIYKMPSAAAAWDSDVYSRVAFSGGCVARVTARTPNAAIMFGLNTDPLTDSSYSSIDYAWYLSDSSSNLYIYLNGNLYKTTGRTYVNGTVLEVRYDGQYVVFLADNVIYARVPDGGKSFYFDSSFYTPSGLVDNVYFGLLNPATASPFLTVGLVTAGDERVYKQSGTNVWDSAAFSLEGYPTAHIQFKMDSLIGWAAVGFTTTPGASTDISNIRFGFYLQTGTWREIINGVVGSGSSGSYDTSTVFTYTYNGGTFTPYVNGVSVDPHGDFSTQNLTAYLQASIYTPGQGINSLLWGPGTTLVLSDTNQIGTNAATSVVNVAVAGPVSIAHSTSTGPGGLLMYSVGSVSIPFDFYNDRTVVVTMTATADMFMNGGSNTSVYVAMVNDVFLGGQPSGPSTATTPSVNAVVTPVMVNINNTTVNQVAFSLEHYFTIPRNTTGGTAWYLFAACIVNVGDTTSTAHIANAALKIEIIKR